MTKTVIAPDIFQTVVTSVRWRKWYTETSPTLTVTGQIHQSDAWHWKCPPLPPQPHTDGMHTHIDARTHGCTHTHTYTYPESVSLQRTDAGHCNKDEE